MSVDLDQNLIELKGIGPKSYKSLSQMGLYTVKDLVEFFPRDYKEYPAPSRYSELRENYFMCICGEIVTRPFLKRGRSMDVVSTKMQIEGGLVDLVWFRMTYIPSILKYGSKYFIYGKIKKKNNRFLIEQGEIYTKEKYLVKMKGLQPVYSLSKGISNNFIEKYIREILSDPGFNEEMLNGEMTGGQSSFKLIAQNYGVDIPQGGIVKTMHFPFDKEEFMKARNYLVFKEFLTFLLSIRYGRDDSKRPPNPMTSCDTETVYDVMGKLDFKLTGDQQKALESMLADMSSEHAMQTMLQGDVGSGKTIVAFLLMIFAAANGYQSVMMAPTEVLARQHYEKMTALLMRCRPDLKCVLLTGSTKGSERKEVLSDISSGEASFVIGTHALIQESVRYKNLALVITDEQHRFGVKQREKLYGKGSDPHFLVMSATPIPRTLAMILYGDLKMETIREMPKGRLPIKNALINSNERYKALRFLFKEIEKGHQGYVICPLIDESETRNGENVTDYYKKLSDVVLRMSNQADRSNPDEPSNVFPNTAASHTFDNAGTDETDAEHDIRIGLLHGKMSPEQKNIAMESFARHETDILVSTSVVEVGVDVPNATVMIIENADTFGLASLHQLRGRIGRGDSQSYCVFVNGSDDKSQKRLETISSTNDGFKIADEDLRSRGPGELFGIRQSGRLSFELGDIYQDSEILKKADMACNDILKKDPELLGSENRYLLDSLKELKTL